MRPIASLLVVVLALLLAAATRASSQAEGEPARGGSMSLVVSYEPPAGDHDGAFVKDRAWTYDNAVTAAALAADGDLDGSGALLDHLQELQRRDGALEFSYDRSGAHGDGPLRSGVQAWVGLAALQWRTRTCSGRHDRLIAGVAGWLLGRKIPGSGLLDGGPDVRWASTEHNLEARAFFAGLAAILDGERAEPGSPAVPAGPRRARSGRGARAVRPAARGRPRPGRLDRRRAARRRSLPPGPS